jgi:hypothetical protein
MRPVFLLLLLFVFKSGFSQTEKELRSAANIRLSFLLFPFTPLLTLEVRAIENFTLQFESNFVNTHGANIKYFTTERMNGSYIFAGIALVENKLLREDGKTTFLPYAGWGYAHRFGKTMNWNFDNRFGIGAATNADVNGIYPIIKTGIGRVF